MYVVYLIGSESVQVFYHLFNIYVLRMDIQLLTGVDCNTMN